MKAKGLLSLLAFSEIRRNIVLLLHQEPKTLRELREHLKLTSPVILPELKRIEEKSLICKENEKYRLTEIGETILEHFFTLHKTLRIFEENEEFWREHDLSGVPKKFRLRIHELGSYKVIVSMPTEIYKPHKEYIENVFKSKWIQGVSPIFHHEYPKTFAALARTGINISLVLTRDVFEKIKREYKKELQKYLSCKNAKLLVSDEDIKVAFTVTNNFLSLGLFRSDTLIYDTYSDLVGAEPTAIRWGEDLFKYYEKRAERVKLQGIR